MNKTSPFCFYALVFIFSISGAFFSCTKNTTQTKSVTDQQKIEALQKKSTKIKTIQLYTEYNPPTLNRNSEGTIFGPMVDRVKKVFDQANIPYNIEMHPWARSYRSSLTEKNSGLFALFRLPSREKKFKWVGPIGVTTSNWVVFALRDKKIQINSQEEMKKYRIGVYTNDARHDYLASKKFEVEVANDNALNLKKLLKGRIDLWAAGRYSGLKLIKDQRVENKVQEVFVFHRAQTYLALNKSVDDKIVIKLQASLDKIMTQEKRQLRKKN